MPRSLRRTLLRQAAQPVRNAGFTLAAVDLAGLKPQQRVIGGRGEDPGQRIPAGGGEELLVQMTSKLCDLVPEDRLDDASQARGHRSASSWLSRMAATRSTAALSRSGEGCR